MRFVGWRGLSDKYRHAVEGHSPWKPDERDPQAITVPNIDTFDIPQELKSVIESEGI